MVRSRFLSISICFCLSASAANAATLSVVGGQLVGASGVDVGGTLYDVAFVEGACVDVFSGCDETSDFTFQLEADALAASLALLDQVFTDGTFGNFDSEPELTNGCVNSVECHAYTPFAGGAQVSSVRASNRAPYYSDETLLVFSNPLFDSAGESSVVWATWSVVPEPSTALLIGIALLGLRGRRTLAA